jgi:chromosomal replication initiator protein
VDFDAVKIWEEVLTNLRSQTECDDFETWIIPAKPIAFTGNAFTISVPTKIYQDSLNHQFRSAIEGLLRSITNSDVTLSIKTEGDGKSGKERLDSLFPTGLNPRFTFDDFVVGSSNKFCWSACQTISETPGKRFNPLFIYGGVGLGKTHLLNAIGNQALMAHPHLRVLYVTSETFMNDLISAIMHKNHNEFRRLYRQVDILLIDDIQFIAGKESTQEEFFHTFNTLINNQKQVVITADRSPGEIHGLENRIISRLSSGLPADIQPPDLETRLAIIEKKCRNDGYTIAADVAMLIAEKVTANIRNIEGTLTRLFAFATLLHSPINMELAERALKDIVTTSVKSITQNEILERVAQHFNLSVGELIGKSRQSSIILPRQIAMYLCRKYTACSLTEIGRVFRRDHTTVLHSLDKINDALPRDQKLRSSVDSLTKLLVEKS